MKNEKQDPWGFGKLVKSRIKVSARRSPICLSGSRPVCLTLSPASPLGPISPSSPWGNKEKKSSLNWSSLEGLSHLCSQMSTDEITSKCWHLVLNHEISAVTVKLSEVVFWQRGGEGWALLLPLPVHRLWKLPLPEGPARGPQLMWVKALHLSAEWSIL